MAVYHFTVHAYRTWGPSHPRGYAVRDEGYRPSDPIMGMEYDDRARFPPVFFDTSMQEILVLGAYDICRRRRWRLHGVGTEKTHAHFVISWKQFISWNQVLQKLKNILSLLLGRAAGIEGRPWFVDRGSRKRVHNPAHLDYLLDTYLPDHRGIFWREGQPLPEDRYGIT